MRLPLGNMSTVSTIRCRSRWRKLFSKRVFRYRKRLSSVSACEGPQGTKMTSCVALNETNDVDDDDDSLPQSIDQPNNTIRPHLKSTRAPFKNFWHSMNTIQLDDYCPHHLFTSIVCGEIPKSYIWMYFWASQINDLKHSRWSINNKDLVVLHQST